MCVCVCVCVCECECVCSSIITVALSKHEVVCYLSGLHIHSFPP